ncbi:FliH/SctL family protein [Nocardioides rubriscoriae]|uniref:FliH/SctL family protein n=1 Tax=Nocardioides rubriscoriae TaxID=642762 RepID=UPI0011DF2F5F|nr:FliH/SctL family protein [Nocardioides rubriscoriae]
MTSSTDLHADAPVLPDLLSLPAEKTTPPTVLEPLATPELRGGDWTRYAGGGALGDRVTEQALGALADRALGAARARGYSIGWAQGRQQAAAEAREVALQVARDAAEAEARRRVEHEQALAALVRAAQAFQESAAEVASRLEDRCLDLAYELTEALVGHQLRTSPEPVADLARRVLTVLPDGVVALVRVHPARALELREHLVATGATVVDDATLGPDDAVVETSTTMVDLAIGTALERVRGALS